MVHSSFEVGRYEKTRQRLENKELRNRTGMEEFKKVKEKENSKEF